MCNRFDIDQFNNLINQNKHNFSIIHHNIRSFACNHEEFSCLTEKVDPLIDVYIFSEFTSVNCSSIDSFDGYHTVRKHSRGGGVLVSVKNFFKSYKLSKISKIYDTFEVCAVRVDISSEKTVFIIAIYRPPNSNTTAFIDELGSYISDNFKPSDHIIFAGDNNIDISPNSYVGHDLVNFYNSHSFNPLNTEVTRETEVSSTIIDHFWTNNRVDRILTFFSNRHGPLTKVAYMSN